MIILPMAGQGSRFVKAGYTTPKYLLPVNHKPVISHVVEGLRPLLEEHDVLFVGRHDQCLEDILHPVFKGKNIMWKTCSLPGHTEGQAHTVYEGLRVAHRTRSEEQVYIFNIDTFHIGFTLPQIFSPKAVDGYLEVFEAPGEHWSFVRPSRLAKRPMAAAEVAEKRRISHLCSSGLYHFSSARMFSDLFEASQDKDVAHQDGGERYVAPLYQAAISEGCDIRYHCIERSVLQVAGTPQEYEKLVSAP